MRAPLALVVIVAVALSGCGRAPPCDPTVDGARYLAAFAATPPMATLGAALVEAGWNVTEGARELAATKAFAALPAPPERQAVHLSLVQPVAYQNVTTARLGSHVEARGAQEAEAALAPAVGEVRATLGRHLGEPTEQAYEGC